MHFSTFWPAERHLNVIAEDDSQSCICSHFDYYYYYYYYYM